MIHINPHNIKEISKEHLIHAEPFVLKRIKFYQDFFNRIANGQKVAFDLPETSPAKKYGMNASTIKMLVQPFLKKNYRNKQKHSLSIEGIKTLLSSNSLYPINYSKQRNRYYGLIQLVNELEKDRISLLVERPSVLSSLKDKSIYNNLTLWKQFILTKILSYEDLTGEGFEITRRGKKSVWGSYTLTSQINANTCVYCNRNWITTVGNQNTKVTNPQLDHFFSKGDFPVLRLSFFNLIPSCETCNARIKKKKEFKYDDNLHPYEMGYGSLAKFKVFGLNTESIQGNANNFLVNIEYDKNITDQHKSKIEKNNELFQIEKVYKNHGDIISELFLRKRLFSDVYLKNLRENIHFGEKVSDGDLYRIAFGGFYDEVNHQKRPFSKLRKDIVEQLKFKL